MLSTDYIVYLLHFANFVHHFEFRITMNINHFSVSQKRNQGVVISRFPIRKEDYATDVRGIITEAISKNGEEEWWLIVLTSEIHGHLGIYAIIGAKMGLFARETLHSGEDELSISSYAGSKPPVSCLNDGLQVSTGATLGHGLIKTEPVETPRPSAKFIFKEKSVTISLKDQMHRNIEHQIRIAFEQSGGINDQYWKTIREIGLKIWIEYDRNKIFEIIN
jgi:formylmethanofuran dehydrogenase subunit E